MRLTLLSTRLQDAGFEPSLSLKAKLARISTRWKCATSTAREIARQWAPLPAAGEPG